MAVATPAITTEFSSLSDVGWYASAYLLTMCSFQLPFGKLYSELSHKYVFLSALAIFEAGSAVSATAQSSLVLIIGRAVTGLGNAGVVSGCIIVSPLALPSLPSPKDWNSTSIVTRLTNHHWQMIGSLTHPTIRPAWIGGMAAVANIAQALGPLIGGVLVTDISWRRFPSPMHYLSHTVVPGGIWSCILTSDFHFRLVFLDQPSGWRSHGIAPPYLLAPTA